MLNIAVANLNHRRLHKGWDIDDVHGCDYVECINAHCWVVTNDGNYVLIQKRGKNHKLFPGKLDISFAGHVDEGEDARHAIIRETFEEGGFDISNYLTKKPKKIYFSEPGIFNGLRYNHNQQAYVYYAILSKEVIDTFKADNNEVGGFKLIKISEFASTIRNGGKGFVPHPRSYYKEILKDILSIKEAIIKTS